MVGTLFNVCLSPFLWTRTTFAFFHSIGNFPLFIQDWKINFRGLQIEVSHILIIRILIISRPWALFGSRFLIIFRISSNKKFIVDRDSRVFLFFVFCCCFFFVRVAGSLLLFLTIKHWLVKKLLKILAFSLKLVTNLSWRNSGDVQRIYLFFRKVLNID